MIRGPHVYTCAINVLHLTRAYLVLTDHAEIVYEGTYTEGAEVDIWGRVGGGGVWLPLGDVSSWKVTNGDNRFLRNSSPCVPVYPASYFRRLYCY
jgi:hypothetical protein